MVTFPLLVNPLSPGFSASDENSKPESKSGQEIKCTKYTIKHYPSPKIWFTLRIKSTKENKMNIGKSISIALIKKGMKGKELAEKLGVDQTSVSKLRSKESCSKATLDALCDVFEMKASEFIALGE